MHISPFSFLYHKNIVMQSYTPASIVQRKRAIICIIPS